MTEIPPISNNLVDRCPKCNNDKLRPYGSDLFVGKDGGCYYKVCEECNTAYAFQKDSNEVKFKGTFEGLIHFQRQLRRRGVV
jgi:hypothetical protein